MPDPREKSKGPLLPRPPPSGQLELGAGPISSPRPSSPELELAEVETALSLLDGRHPEFARAEREKAEALARRKRELEIASQRARKRAVRGAIVGGVIIAGMGVAGFFVRERHERGRRGLEGSIAYARTFDPLAFAEVPRSPWDDPERLEVPLVAGTCAIALGGSNGKPITIEVAHDGDTLEAQGSFGFCTCSNETVVITAKGGERGQRSVRLLRTDARDFGSVLGFARSPVKPASVDRCACLEDQLDGWLASAKNVLGAPDLGWSKAAPQRESLTRMGIRVVHSAPPSMSLVPMPVPAGGCAVITSSNELDTMALRAPGGNKVLEAARGTLAVCSKSARAYGVWHEGKGTLTILEANAAQVAGRMELPLLLDRAGLGRARTWVEPDELGWDASLALAAGHISGVRTMDLALGAPLPPETKLIAFSISGGARLEPTDGDELACEHGESSGDALLCAQTAPQTFRETSGKGRIGVATAPLPLWMKPLSSARAAAPAILGLGVLARKLGARGFEATALEAVTETSSGASVLGRAGEDAIVAVTLQPTPPFALPLSDGPSWSVEGEPLVIPLAPGRKVALRSRISPSGNEDLRRTVVFRRAVVAANK